VINVQRAYDAIVVGAGPNGLAAAATLARAGCSVLVVEAAATVGGGARSAELTLPGIVHDVCSAVHPLAAFSPCFRDLPLARHGLRWIESPAAVAHPFDDGTAAVLRRSISATSETLSSGAASYRRLMSPLVARWNDVADALLGPPLRWPAHPLALARFGRHALRSASGLARATFPDERARGLFAGLAAHSFQPLERLGTAAFGLVLGILGHEVGWPIPAGGAQKIADALAACVRELGGEIATGLRVERLDALPPSRLVLCDVTPRQLLAMAGDRLPARYRRRLARYRYGPGVFKIDFALDGPIPWKAQECSQAATVHLGGRLEEIAASEQAPWRGRTSERPFVLLAQPTLFDPTRAPDKLHTAWAYCHVPPRSVADMTQAIEAQIERFAPGFRERILARHTATTADLERENPNHVGGDINGGVQDLWQILARPILSPNPYATPVEGLYLCSSSTPPGGGVHGMSGYHAARAALRALGRSDARRVQHSTQR
jgi:phytoene dehydrogenase-like protein